MNYKIVLKTSINNILRVKNCVQTWLQDQDYVCLTDRLSGEYPEISGSNRTDYHSAEEKTVYLLNLIKNTNILDNYDWLIFIDDDAIINIESFKNIMHLMDKNFVYGLPISSFPKFPQLQYPSGGAGYFISPDLIKKHRSIQNNNWGIEDASIGKWIKDNNITLSSMPINIKLNGWFPFQDHWENIRKYGDDYATEMIKTFDILESNTISKYLTHHYIRWFPLMNYIYKIFINR